MKRVLIGIVLGAAAGVCGMIGYELTDQRIWGWLTTGVLLSIASQLPHLSKGRWALWGLLGGGIIVVSDLVGRVIPFPILLTWSLLGTVFGVLCAPSGLGWRITGGGIGLLAGTLGIGILLLITIIILPSLGLPTTFDYDIDVLGLVFAGIFIGGTTAWLRGRSGKKTRI
jgi:hypothetical protein